jgi:acylphosphatase
MVKVEQPGERRPQNSTLVRLSAVVRGRVQGVSFRYYTRHRAAELGLTGTVRNLWDGSVEVIAEGPRRDVEELLASLRVGPRPAFVTEVDVEWSAPRGDRESFEVLG